MRERRRIEVDAAREDKEETSLAGDPAQTALTTNFEAILQYCTAHPLIFEKSAQGQRQSLARKFC